VTKQLVPTLPADYTNDACCTLAACIAEQEAIMTRKYIDCREFPSESHCTVAIAADSDQELLDAAVQHAVAVHGHEDTPELRSQLRHLFKDGTPPVELGRPASVPA
jgi:predicted small metal-binding protein